MYFLNFTIEGVADFLFNRMTEEDLSGFRGGKSSGDLTDEQRQKLAEKKVYADDAGLYLPAWTVKRAILEGAHSVGLKLNRKPLRQRLAAVMFVTTLPRFSRDGQSIQERDYLHETGGRIPPRKGVYALIRRPALRAGWTLRATLTILDDGVPADAVRQSLEASGLYVGIGAWRPEFGRFIVREWDNSVKVQA